MSKGKKQQGIGIIKFILLSPFVLIGLVILTVIFSLLYKAYWDYRVELMCEKDGGRSIYQVVKLSEGELKKMRGNSQFISLPTRQKAKKDDKFAHYYETARLYKGVFGLKISRYVYQVIRLKDNKVLAEQIQYSRVRGDFIPLPAVHHSTFSCPQYKDSFFNKPFNIKVDELKEH